MLHLPYLNICGSQPKLTSAVNSPCPTCSKLPARPRLKKYLITMEAVLILLSSVIWSILPVVTDQGLGK